MRHIPMMITYSKDRTHHHVVMLSESGFISLGKGDIELFFRVVNAATKCLSSEIQTTDMSSSISIYVFISYSMFHLPRKPQQAFSSNAFLLWCFSSHKILKRVVGGSIALQLVTDFLSTQHNQLERQDNKNHMCACVCVPWYCRSCHFGQRRKRLSRASLFT